MRGMVYSPMTVENLRSIPNYSEEYRLKVMANVVLRGMLGRYGDDE